MLPFKDFARIILVVHLLFSASNVLAQDFELLQLQSAYYIKQPFEDASFEGEIGFFEWGVQVNVPQLLKKHKHTIMIHKIGYAQLVTNTTIQLPTGLLEVTQAYHSVIYNLGFISALHANWRLLTNFIPTLASDFEVRLSGNDLLFQANALMVNVKNEKLKYGFGLAYTTRLGRQLVIPMGLFKWNAQKLEVDLVLPNKLSVMIKPKKHGFSFGLKAGLNGGVFNNASTYPMVSRVIDEVGYSRVTFGPAISIRLKEVILVSLQGGLTLNRRLEFIDSNNEVIDRTPPAAPFLGVGISLVPKKNHSQFKLNM